MPRWLPSAAVAAAAFLLVAGTGRASDCTRTSTGLVPLTDLGTGLYLGQFQGGLYPGGSNAVPAAHLAAGLAAAAGVVPRDTSGAPDPLNGRIVLISVGMSNATLEFCIANAGTTDCTADSFMGQAAASPAVDHTTVALVNGAVGGQVANDWLDPAGSNYDNIATLLGGEGLSEAQVQAVWVKEADPVPTVSLPSPTADAYVLEGYLGAIARAIRARYPHVAVVFFSSRIYAGYATSTLNPEPYAYESGFAVKWLVEAQITQMAMGGTPADPIAGDLDYTTVAPWIAWGPYLWADGTTPRSGDGLTYDCTDLLADGTHPASGGVEKVGSLLLNFFLTSAVTRPWFAVATSTTTTTTVFGETTTTTLPGPDCPPQPRDGCSPAGPGRGELTVVDGGRDRLRWRWVDGPVAKAAFGSPSTATSYVLCVYEAGLLRLQAHAPAGGTCSGVPCWRETSRAFRYVDDDLTPDGVQKLMMVAGASGEIMVRGRGARLGVPVLPLGSPVRVQLDRTDAPGCWEATYGGTPVRNDGRRFRAWSD